MEYMVRTYRSGKVIEKVSFPVNPGTKIRKPKSKGSIKRKQDWNERNGIKRLARILNCNFEAGDLFIKFGYDSKAEFGKEINREYDLAEKEMEKFIRRLKTQAKKAGIDPKYVYITSDMNGDTGEYKRPHHHMVIKHDGFEFKNGKLYFCGKELEKIWKKGSISFESLREEDTYINLAAYLYRQARRLTLNDCKYHASRNLAKPVLISERIVHTNRKLRLPKGAKLISRSNPNYTPDGVQYLCYAQKQKEGEKNDTDGKSVQKRMP